MSSNHQDSKQDADTDGQAFQAEDNAAHYGQDHEQAIQHDDDFSLLLSGVESDEEFGQGSDEVQDEHALYDAIFRAKPPHRGDLHIK